jgi:hypothetical protein
MSIFVLSCLVLSCLVLTCLVLSSLVLPCLVLPCLDRYQLVSTQPQYSSTTTLSGIRPTPSTPPPSPVVAVSRCHRSPIIS